MRAEAGIRRGYELLGTWSPDAYQQAEAELTEAYDRGRALGAPRLEVDALLGVAHKHRLAGEAAKAVLSFEDAVERAVSSNDRKRFVLAAVGLASSLVLEGDFE